MTKVLNYILLIIMSLPFASMHAQDGNQIEGEVSFTNSTNIYIRFANTSKISLGDTIFTGADKNIPCLRISMKSSSSVVCERINDCDLKRGSKINYTIKQIELEELPEELETEGNNLTEILDTLADQTIVTAEEYNPYFRERIRARISAGNFSNISPYENSDRHRFMTRFSLRADHINDSKVSIDAYVNYRQNFLQQPVSADYQTKFFRVYNAAVKYSFDSTMVLSLGRQVNRKFSSVGSIDGLQFEKTMGNLSVGLIGGFKPDINHFELNTNLLQYGGYLNYQLRQNRNYVSATLGLMEQRNNGLIDRRYLYFQNNSSLGSKLNLFVAAELDIYSNVGGLVKTKFRLSNLFTTLRFRPTRKVNISLSYDNRKRILYYETYKTEIEQILEDDIARQGLRLRVNWRALRYINTGVSVSRRFQSDQQNASENINFYLSHSKLPGLNANLTVRVNLNQSNYLQSRMASISLNKNLINKKLQARIYYRLVNYRYLESTRSVNQYYIGTNMFYRLNKTMRLGVSVEMNRRDQLSYYSFHTKLIKRFGS